MSMFVGSMMVIAVVLIFGSAAATQGSSTAVKPTASLDHSLAGFLQRAPGEYDNNEQVWQEDLDKVVKPHRHSHVIVVDAHAVAIGPHTLFVQKNMAGKPDEAPRLNLLSVSFDPAAHVIRLDAYTFGTEAAYAGADARPVLLAAIKPADVAHEKGCSIYLTDRGDHFGGGVRPAECRVHSGKDRREIVINDSVSLSAAGLWLRDEGRDIHGEPISGSFSGVPSKNRRVRYFSGWRS